VFDILRESRCTDCGKELLGGGFLFMEGKRPLCLSCADLDHLVYLPRGDTALTRHVVARGSGGGSAIRGLLHLGATSGCNFLRVDK
jgi:phage FluMu protein Com